MEYIVCSAVWYPWLKTMERLPVNLKSGVVVCGIRHNDCYAPVFALTGYQTGSDNKEYIDGVLTNYRRFVDRKEGYEIAKRAQQVFKDSDGLTSEDLWPKRWSKNG